MERSPHTHYYRNPRRFHAPRVDDGDCFCDVGESSWIISPDRDHTSSRESSSEEGNVSIAFSIAFEHFPSFSFFFFPKSIPFNRISGTDRETLKLSRLIPTPAGVTKKLVSARVV